MEGGNQSTNDKGFKMFYRNDMPDGKIVLMTFQEVTQNYIRQ